MSKREENLERLEEIKDEIRDLVEEALSIAKEEGEGGTAKSYWYAHIVGALDDENEFLGGSMVTIQDTIGEIEAGETDEDEDDDDLAIDTISTEDENAASFKVRGADREVTENERKFIAVLHAMDDDFMDEIYLTYSGRGMFGQQCAAINCDSVTANSIKAQLDKFGVRYSQDNTGLYLVVYAS